MVFAPQLKLASHERFVKYLKGEVIPVINTEISVSSICNAQCPVCFYRDDNNIKETFILRNKLLTFLFDADTNGLEAVTWSGGGEPTLHPDFSDIVQQVSQQTNLEQGLFTNALLQPTYPACLLKWIRVTKTNEPFPEEHVLLLRQQCVNTGLCINYRGKEDDRNICKALEIAHKMDLRYVQVRPALNIMGATTNIEKPDIQDEKLILNKYKWAECGIKDRGYAQCEAFHFSPMIWENGIMSVCMYMRHHEEYNIGSIYENNFLDLCRKMPSSLPVSNDCQICCKNNEDNKLINDCKKLEDKKFI
jgi:organic radical activating enzyme